MLPSDNLLEVRGQLSIHHMGSRTPTQVVQLGGNLAGVQVLCLILITFCGLFQGSSSAGQHIYHIHEHSSTQMGKMKGQSRALEPPS